MEKPQWPKLPEGHDLRKKLSDKDKQLIRDLRQYNKMSDRQIAKIIGVNHTTVRYWLGDKERQNAKSIRLQKLHPKSKEKQKEIRDRNRDHTIEVVGKDIVQKFRRENRKATRSLYKDFRKSCLNPDCPGRVLSKHGWYVGYRYSSRLHKKCPKCDQ